MTSPTHSGAGCGNESDQDEVILANFPIASKKATNVFGSALADQVVGALHYALETLR